MTPLISVVIPTYNYGHLLPRALDSVIHQQTPLTELIVIDDGSTDDTPAIMADFCKRYPQITHIRQQNGGAARARNHGIARSQGKYVLLLDADDELLPGALQRWQAAVMAHPEAGVFLGGYVSVFPDGREKIHRPSSVPSSSSVKIAKRYLLHKSISISHGCTLFLRTMLLARPYAERLRRGEDVPVFAHVLTAGKPIISIPQSMAKIHKHADSLRHQRVTEDSAVDLMVEEVFVSLPTQCQPLRKRYKAQRFLSLGKQAIHRADMRAARRFYFKAIKLHPWQIVRGSHLPKFLRALFAR